MLTESGNRVNGSEYQLKIKQINRLSRWMCPVLWLLVCLVIIIGGVGTGISSAGQRSLKRDTNNDNVIDQIAYVDLDGNLIRLENDKNADGHMESVQYYENGHLIRTEKDTNDDRALDIRNNFAKGRRISQEKMNPKGHVIYVILFDENEKILEIKKDTDQNGSFDRIFYYTSGMLSSSTIDGPVTEMSMSGKPLKVIR